MILELIKQIPHVFGIKTTMRVKLAAKMLLIAWTMMKNETAFNPELLEANVA